MYGPRAPGPWGPGALGPWGPDSIKYWVGPPGSSTRPRQDPYGEFNYIRDLASLIALAALAAWAYGEFNYISRGGRIGGIGGIDRPGSPVYISSVLTPPQMTPTPPK